MIQHSSPISGIDAHFPYVATAGYDNRVILWDARTHEALAESRHDHLANQCRFSSSGTMLATSSSDYSARIWSIPDMRLRAILADHEDDVEMTAISPDECRVATVSRDRAVRIYSIDGKLLHRMDGHESDVLSVEWAAQGSQLITSGDDATVRRWDAETGTLTSTTRLGDVETDTIAIVDDELLFLGNDNGELVAITQEAPPNFYAAHDAGIKRLAYDRDRLTLVSASYDRTVRFWQLMPGGIPTQNQYARIPSEVWPRSFARLDQFRWVFGTFGTTYAELDAADSQWITSKVEPTPGLNAVRAVQSAIYSVGDSGEVSKDGRQVAALGSCCNFLTSFGGHVFTGGQLGILFDARTGAVVYKHTSPLNCATTIGDREDGRLIIGTYTGEGLVFREDGMSVTYERQVKLHDNAIKGLSSHGATLFSVCATGAVGFHHFPDLQACRFIPNAHERICNGAASLQSGEFVSVSRDRTLRLWNTSGEQLAIVQTPHENSIKCVAADSATRLIATGGYRGRVAVYSLSGERWVYNRRVTHAGISGLSETGEPGTFLASSYDGTVYTIRAANV
ncbi:MAG: WD40 repeat domain-containing protein [Streptosporangiaceae bacterium]